MRHEDCVISMVHPMRMPVRIVTFAMFVRMPMVVVLVVAQQVGAEEIDPSRLR
jgi:hypothetical protein